MSDERRCDGCGQVAPVLIWQKVPGTDLYVKHCRACKENLQSPRPP